MKLLSTSFYSSQMATLALLVLAVTILTGCGGLGADMGTVTGKVTLDGQPLSNALVSFYPAEGRPSMGTTDSEGKYSLDYTADKKGAMTGTHTVRITVTQVSGEGQPARPEKEKIPARYNEKSELTAEVKSGKNENVDFALESN